MQLVSIPGNHGPRIRVDRRLRSARGFVPSRVAEDASALIAALGSSSMSALMNGLSGDDQVEWMQAPFSIHRGH
jgi:hypothetical protein